MAEPEEVGVRNRKLPKQKALQGPSEEPKQETEKKARRDPGPKLGPIGELRFFTRLVLIMGAAVVVYFSANDVAPFAKQSDSHEHRKMKFPCSDKYKEETAKFQGCGGETCGRAVMDLLVSGLEAERLKGLAERVLSLARPAGGASVLDLHSGALTHGSHFINIFTLNTTGFISPSDFRLYREVKEKIRAGIAHSFGLSATTLYLTKPTFFSKLTADPPASVHDQYWQTHVDKEQYESFHYTSVIYLNDYGIDFKGGRFMYLDNNSTHVSLEPRKGRVSMFTSGWENTHYVERVKSGERLALTISFTCHPQSGIPDPSLVQPPSTPSD